ncbi:MAG: hypothetical protein WCG03_09410 [Kiritimatiellales bacterium]
MNMRRLTDDELRELAKRRPATAAYLLQHRAEEAAQGAKQKAESEAAPSDMVEEELQQAGEKMYAETGVVSDVGPELYASFCNMNDREMTALVRCILSDRAKEINRQLNQKTFTASGLLKMTTEMLNLFARGILKAHEGGKCVIYKVVGPAPTPEECEDINIKIEAAHIIILDSFLGHFNKPDALPTNYPQSPPEGTVCGGFTDHYSAPTGQG